ncbi:MAG: hypothetical protein HN667_01055 [Chloroflexi bacterium]|nr:hypothetical protein [Chloroflexota bacterium]
MVRGIPINGCTTTKICCRTNCLPGRRTKPENHVHFASVGEARKNGFRACKVCKPISPADDRAWLPKSER